MANKQKHPVADPLSPLSGVEKEHKCHDETAQEGVVGRAHHCVGFAQRVRLFDSVVERVVRSLKNINDGSISCLPVCSLDFFLTPHVFFLLLAFPLADSLMKNVCFFNTCTDGDRRACR